MSQGTVLAQVMNERDAQDEKWGGAKHDDTHTPQEWCGLIMREMDKAFAATVFPDPEEFRRRMIRVSALAVAATESHDRKKEAK